MEIEYFERDIGEEWILCVPKLENKLVYYVFEKLDCTKLVCIYTVCDFVDVPTECWSWKTEIASQKISVSMIFASI